MKVSCLQENIAKGLSIVSRAVASRSTLPVLGNVLVATDQSRLRLSANNLELAGGAHEKPLVLLRCRYSNFAACGLATSER